MVIVIVMVMVMVMVMVTMTVKVMILGDCDGAGGWRQFEDDESGVASEERDQKDES